jgi:hypothetical protein
VDVEFRSHDPDGTPRGCAMAMGFPLQDPLAAFMDVVEVGAYCTQCASEDQGTVRSDLVEQTPSRKPRKFKPLKRRRVLGDITSKVN